MRILETNEGLIYILRLKDGSKVRLLSKSREKALKEVSRLLGCGLNG